MPARDMVQRVQTSVSFEMPAAIAERSFVGLGGTDQNGGPMVKQALGFVQGTGRRWASLGYLLRRSRLEPPIA